MPQKGFPSGRVGRTQGAKGDGIQFGLIEIMGGANVGREIVRDPVPHFIHQFSRQIIDRSLAIAKREIAHQSHRTHQLRHKRHNQYPTQRPFDRPIAQGLHRFWPSKSRQIDRHNQEGINSSVSQDSSHHSTVNLR